MGVRSFGVQSKFHFCKIGRARRLQAIRLKRRLSAPNVVYKNSESGCSPKKSTLFKWRNILNSITKICCCISWFTFVFWLFDTQKPWFHKGLSAPSILADFLFSPFNPEALGPLVAAFSLTYVNEGKDRVRKLSPRESEFCSSFV